MRAMMKKTAAALSAVLVFGGSPQAGAGQAQAVTQDKQETTKPPQPPVEPKRPRPTKTMTARGEVVKADASSVTLKTKAGEESFAVNSDTRITQAGKLATTGDVTAGETATVSYTKEGDQMTATKIAVATKAAPKAAKAPKKPKDKK